MSDPVAMTEEEKQQDRTNALEARARLQTTMHPYGPDKFPATCSHCQRRIWEGYTDDEDTITLCATCWEALTPPAMMALEIFP